jgi:hypothetical protein
MGRICSTPFAGNQLRVPGPWIDSGPELGSLWTVGVGSVGTAVLYFLTPVTNRFYATLFDMDFVKVQNLDHSPIFTDTDAHARSPHPIRQKFCKMFIFLFNLKTAVRAAFEAQPGA